MSKEFAIFDKNIVSVSKYKSIALIILGNYIDDRHNNKIDLLARQKTGLFYLQNNTKMFT